MGLQSHFDSTVAVAKVLDRDEYHWGTIYEQSAVILDRPMSVEAALDLERLLLADCLNPVFDTLPHASEPWDAPYGFILFGNVHPEMDEILRGFGGAVDQYKRDFNVSAYKRNQTAPSNEKMFEMRAAFGPGVEVVDVLSGRKVTT